MLNADQNIRWLVDRDLPQLASKDPDTLPATHCRRDILAEALREGRWVVTGNPRFLELEDHVWGLIEGEVKKTMMTDRSTRGGATATGDRDLGI